MNQGLYGFPSTFGLAAANIISITEFDASGSYAIPSNAASLQIVLVGGGGGGGGGASGVNAATNTGGGGGGGGGSIVFQECLIVDDLNASTLRISIGAGGAGGSRGNNGAGGVGQPGASSTITIPGRPGFFIRAIGGPGGGFGTTPTTTGAAVGGAGRASSINYVTATNTSGANGSYTLGANDTGWTGTFVFIVDPKSNAGAGGGSGISNTTATRGGSIETVNASTVNIPIVYDMNLGVVGGTAGITAAYGGITNAGGFTGSGQNGRFMIGSSMKLFGGGIGGAGGGGANSVGGGNGGNGWRGGGGGGGGGTRVAAGAIPGGTGGNGGNGYCCIVARA